MPVAVHRVEVELGRIDDEVVIQVLGVGQRFEKPPPTVERDLRLAPIADACPGLRFLRSKLDSDAVMRCAALAGLGRGDDAVVVPAGESYPGADLVCPSLDL